MQVDIGCNVPNVHVDQINNLILTYLHMFSTYCFSKLNYGPF